MLCCPKVKAEPVVAEPVSVPAVVLVQEAVPVPVSQAVAVSVRVPAELVPAVAGAEPVLVPVLGHLLKLLRLLVQSSLASS